MAGFQRERARIIHHTESPLPIFRAAAKRRIPEAVRRARQRSLQGVGVAFATATVATMAVAVMVMVIRSGFGLVHAFGFQRHARAPAGLSVLLCGVAVKFGL